MLGEESRSIKLGFFVPMQSGRRMTYTLRHPELDSGSLDDGGVQEILSLVQNDSV